MKTLMFPGKSYSWLQFPATLKDYPENRHPHLTVKFFGETIVNRYAIEHRVGQNLQKSLRVGEMTWEPKFWSSPFDHRNYYVLTFKKFPSILNFIHDLFDVIKDPYMPWVPHITVTPEYFRTVEDRQLTPLECELEFGEIELCLGGPNL